MSVRSPAATACASAWGSARQQHHGGDRSLYVEDPEGNIVAVWDFFERGEGASLGASALADD